MDKSEIRRAGLSARRAMGESARRWASGRIQERLRGLESWRGAGSVVVYLSVGEEVETWGLLRELLGEGRVVACPRVMAGGRIEAHRVLAEEELVVGKWGIAEPGVDRPLGEGPGLCVVPGVAFDELGHRVGMGKGYFDRYLGGLPGAGAGGTVAVGLCFECQMVEAIPAEPHDVGMDVIVTEERVIEVGKAGA
ncbi:MAG: 5-formyltetrahydrofolate cyclo-ligase [Phycisphaeraceae bacterium]|nr:5-formyltetrahydrofolate cyclo-ligase [Phycisphaeraceae bacterium]